MGIPESAGRGAGTSAGKNGGAGQSAGTSAGRSGPLGKQRQNLASTCASALASTPIFASTPASTFLEFPFWGTVPGRRGLNRNPEKEAFARGALRKFVANSVPNLCKLAGILFVHQRKGAQNCRKFVPNLKVNFGQLYANASFPMPPSLNF